MSSVVDELMVVSEKLSKIRDAAARTDARQHPEAARAFVAKLDEVVEMHKELRALAAAMGHPSDDAGTSRAPAATESVGDAVVKPHARSFGGDVPSDTPRVEKP